MIHHPKHPPCVKRDTENVDRGTQTQSSQLEDDGLIATCIGLDVRPIDLTDRKVLGGNGGSEAPHIGPDAHQKRADGQHPHVNGEQSTPGY
jgi:hypothetical protein